MSGARLLQTAMVALGAGALLAACGGGDASPDAAGADVDAVPPSPDATPSDCPASLDYGATAAVALEAYWFGEQESPLAVIAYADITGAAMPDEVQVELYAGVGAFAGSPIEVGTYQLTGDEIQYSTCGVCVLLVANKSSDGTAAQLAPDDPDATYLATGGTIEIVQLDPELQVELRDVTFARVEIDDATYTSTATEDGCSSAIDQLDLAGPLGPWN